MDFVPRLSTVVTESGRLLGALIVIIPVVFTAWNWTATAAAEKAEAYIQQVVDQRFDELTARIEQLTNSINRLVRGQSVEVNQSAEQARINRQILCLQELQIDPSKGTIEECQNIE